MAYKDEGKETKFAVKGYKIEVSIFEEKRIGSHIQYVGERSYTYILMLRSYTYETNTNAC